MTANLAFSFANPPSASGKTPRYFQQEAFDQVDAEMVRGNRQRALIQLPTGCGKTFLGGMIAGHVEGRVWWLAHVRELLTQAKKALHDGTGEPIGLEKARIYSSGERITVCSVQTVRNADRRGGIAPPDWIVIDECHRAEGDSYQGILKAYPNAKVIGLSATPHRTDGKDLRKTFGGDPIYRYTVPQAIKDGYWARFRWLQKKIAGVRLEKLAANNGDFSDAELERIASQNQIAEAYAQGWFKFGEDRKTILFTPGRVSGQKITDYLNAEKPGIARFIDGETPEQIRRDIFEGYAAGDFKVLVNVQVCVEGYDDPATSNITLCRQTKSWSRYCQMVGRGARIHPGKDSCLVLDFTGSSGRHKLVGPVDMIGDEMDATEAEKALAVRKLENDPDIDVAEAIEAAKEDEAEISAMEHKMRISARERYRVVPDFVDRNAPNPLETLHIRDPEILQDHLSPRARPAAERDLKWLKDRRVPIPEFLTEKQAKKLKQTYGVRMAKGLASPGQVAKLAEFGYVAINWSRPHAGDVLTQLANNGWKPLEADQMRAAKRRTRVTGEEG